MAVVLSKTRIDFEKCAATALLLGPGSYGLEVVGAAGGDSAARGGLGGRSYGVLTLMETTEVFVHVGEKGLTASEPSTLTRKACNGGGSGNRWTGSPVGSGGGSTDIRIGKDDVLYRVIVAGGGGGAGWTSDRDGGDGGGKTGGDGLGADGGYGGQELWCSDICKSGEKECVAGGLLEGGNGETDHQAAGGGGGLIGGASGYGGGAGGGGSGYVFYSNAKRNSNITVLDPKFFLQNAQTEKFNNAGNGYAIITPLTPTLSPSNYNLEYICRTYLKNNKNVIFIGISIFLINY